MTRGTFHLYAALDVASINHAKMPGIPHNSGPYGILKKTLAVGTEIEVVMVQYGRATVRCGDDGMFWDVGENALVTAVTERE